MQHTFWILWQTYSTYAIITYWFVGILHQTFVISMAVWNKYFITISFSLFPIQLYNKIHYVESVPNQFDYKTLAPSLCALAAMYIVWNMNPSGKIPAVFLAAKAAPISRNVR